MDFTLFSQGRNTLSTAIAPYRVKIVGCADEGGASFANDGLRKLSPSYDPSRRHTPQIFYRISNQLSKCHFPQIDENLNKANRSPASPNLSFTGFP